MVDAKDMMNNLPIEKQKEMLDMFSKTIAEQTAKIEAMEKKHSDQIEQLKGEFDAKIAEKDREIKKRDRALETMVTTGIDMGRIDPLDVIAPYLSSTPERMQLMLDTNRPEFVKFVMNQYMVLMDEKMQRLEDMNLDINGDSIGIKLSQVAKFFDEHPTTKDFTKPEDTATYTSKVQDFLKAYYDLTEWKKVQADIANINEMSAQAIFHYAIEEMKSNLHKAKQGEIINEVAINPAEKLDALKAVKEAEANAPEVAAQKAAEEEAFKVETTKKLGVIEQGIMALQGLVSEEKPKVEPPVDEENEEEVEEQKPKKRKKD